MKEEALSTLMMSMMITMESISMRMITTPQICMHARIKNAKMLEAVMNNDDDEVDDEDEPDL